eukprot:COSAG06_NODE_53871_length_297_cov_1.308081_1_plen_30_part_01
MYVYIKADGWSREQTKSAVNRDNTSLARAW